MSGERRLKIGDALSCRYVRLRRVLHVRHG